MNFFGHIGFTSFLLLITSAYYCQCLAVPEFGGKKERVGMPGMNMIV